MCLKSRSMWETIAVRWSFDIWRHSVKTIWIASESELSIYLQSGGLNSILGTGNEEESLHYTVDGLSLAFTSTDFTRLTPI